MLAEILKDPFTKDSVLLMTVEQYHYLGEAGLIPEKTELLEGVVITKIPKSLGISAYRLAKETKINPTRVSEIVNGKRGISVDTALRFSKFFGNSVEFWMGIQDEYEIRNERSKIRSS